MRRTALYTTETEPRLIAAGLAWNFHDADTNEHLHTLHPYPAKFIPQIPRKAILAWSRPGDLVYDPFCGCGTTLLESSLLGRPSIGTDNNSVAVLATSAKIARYTSTAVAELNEFASTLDARLSNPTSGVEQGPGYEAVSYWFDREVYARISAIKSLVREVDEPARTMLMAVLSAIIVRVSYQDSDTRYARISRNVRPADVEQAFKAKLRAALQSLPSVRVPRRARSRVRLADARSVPFIHSASVSLIVTSPPYLNAYDYHKYHRQRLHWIDGDIAFARDQEIGSHDVFTKPHATPDRYFDDMSRCFEEWRRVLKRRGRCLVLIGDAIVSGQPVSVADEFARIAIKCGLRLEKRAIRELHSTKRSFNVKNGRISHEHVLLFQKR